METSQIQNESDFWKELRAPIQMLDWFFNLFFYLQLLSTILQSKTIFLPIFSDFIAYNLRVPKLFWPTYFQTFWKVHIFEPVPDGIMDFGFLVTYNFTTQMYVLWTSLFVSIINTKCSQVIKEHIIHIPISTKEFSKFIQNIDSEINPTWS